MTFDFDLRARSLWMDVRAGARSYPLGEWTCDNTALFIEEHKHKHVAPLRFP
jgi:hypothetical protein